MATPKSLGNTIKASQLVLELDGPFGGQAWYLISANEPTLAIDAVCDALGGAGVSLLRIPASAPDTLLATPPPPTVGIPTGTWSWADQDYAMLDRLRGEIREAWPVLIWITTPAAAQSLVHHAPSFAAFFLPDIGIWSDGAMSEEQLAAHLVQLRDRYKLNDGEVIEMAKRGELPQDADHHAWLILLGRGDLIARRVR